MDVIHHHHRIEETFYFGEIEKKLGAGTLSGNIEEHTHFVPLIEEFQKWLKDVQSGKEQYDVKVFMEKVNSFSDIMLEHLNHVRECASSPLILLTSFATYHLGDHYAGVEQNRCSVHSEGAERHGQRVHETWLEYR